jgi:hypothetical protein
VLLAIAVLLAGLATGAAYPLLVSLACGRHPDATGVVTSVLFVSGSAARILFPWLMGVFGSVAGLGPGVMTTGLVLIVVAILVGLSGPETNPSR